MRAQLLAALALALFAAGAAAQPTPPPVDRRAVTAERPPELLSSYRFFLDAAGREPNAGVTPYDLNTPLYSDGALKFRYVYLPPGAQAQYREDGVFEFPIGSVLIKTFAFAADMRSPQRDVRYLETRLLIRRAEGWVALPYVWNDAQTDARLAPVGDLLPVSITDADGAPLSLEWEVPNRNQCKGCHDADGELTPIGPSARNLNRDHDYDDGAENQLARWTALALLAGAPDYRTAPRAPDAFDPASGSLDARARAYLDVNCAHCHNPSGPAHTSGLDLSWSQSAPLRWGVYKRPVAAGRGSAGMAFAIEPGHPERSFLLHRMESTDPGVMMPEIGRQLVDRRAIALMRDWIAEMERD